MLLAHTDIAITAKFYTDATLESDMLAQAITNRGAALMFFVAGVLAALAGLFYAAGHHQIGSLGVTMCRYGPAFCDNPLWVLTAAGLAAAWAALVSIR